MIERVVLTGAGYSKNFGGFLGTEFRERMLSHPAVAGSEYLSRLVVSEELGFEQVLQTVREYCRPNSPEAQGIETAVYDTFGQMHSNMVTRQRHYTSALNTVRISKFLFEATGGKKQSTPKTSFLFTLNQDLLYERTLTEYACPVLPGIPQDRRYFKPDEIDHFDLKQLEVTVPDDLPDDLAVPERLNVVKLHGSFNWRSHQRRLLVVGGDKQVSIMQSPLLKAYRDLFYSVLTSGTVRLFVIGYSFLDVHINQIIETAVLRGLRLWIWDPRPLDQIRKATEFVGYVHGQAVYRANPIQGAIRGYMSDSFSSVFNPNDHADAPWHDTIDRFLTDYELC